MSLARLLALWAHWLRQRFSLFSSERADFAIKNQLLWIRH